MVSPICGWSHTESFSDLLKVTQQVWLGCYEQDSALGFSHFPDSVSQPLPLCSFLGPASSHPARGLGPTHTPWW